MKVAIVIPPVEDFYFSPRRFASLGALKSAQLFFEKGIETTIFDFTKGNKKEIKLPLAINYLSSYIMKNEKGSCSFFTSYYHFGYDIDKCVKTVISVSYDIVFVSLFAFCYADSAINFAKKLKEIDGNIKIALAGAGASIFPEYFKNYFDFIITGEAEIFLEEILKIKELQKINNTGIKHSCMDLTSDDFISAANSNSNKRYTTDNSFTPSAGIADSNKKSLFVSVMLSRGCYKKCRFCSNFISHGRGFRKTTPESLYKTLFSMKDIFKKHSGKKIFINIEDDNILFDKNNFFEQLNILKNFFAGFSPVQQIFFSAENGLDFMLLDTETCRSLIDKYNFRQFNFTLSSLNSSTVSAQDRKSSPGKLKNLLHYIGEHRKVTAVTYFIAGLSGDSPEKTVESLLFIDRNPGLSGISMFYAVPGLPDFDTPVFFKNINPVICRGSSAYPWNNALTTKQLITAFRISRTSNFLKKDIASLSEIEIKLRDMIISNKKLFTVTVDNKIVEAKEIDYNMVKLFFEGKQQPEI